MTKALPLAASGPAAPDAAARASMTFVLELGRALHRYGAPAHRIEDVMGRVSARLGLEGQFYSTPTALIASFGPPPAPATSLLRVQPGESGLDKLGALDTVVDEVVDGRLDPDAGLEAVRRILDRPPPFGRLAVVAAYALVSFTAARFFGGGLAEACVAGLIGLSTGALSLVFTRTPSTVRVFELVAALVAAALAQGAALVVPLSPYVAIVSGVIVLVPGFTLTVAMAEVATRNLVSGTARLTAAAVIFLEIAFGVALGERLVTGLFGAAVPAAPATGPWWTEALAVAGSAVGLLVLFQAPRRRLGWVVLAAFVAYYGARTGAWLLGPALGASVGAFLAAAASNLYARRLRRTALVPLTPAMILLVPGSIGFRSLSSLLDRDVVSGVDTAFTMVLVAVAIVAGLLVANVVVSPRRLL